MLVNIRKRNRKILNVIAMDAKKLGTSAGANYLQFVLNTVGLWPRKIPYYLSLLYKLYSLIIIVIFLFLYDLSMTVYINYIDNVEEATNSLCMTLTLITLFGKVLNFILFLSKIQKLLLFGQDFQLESDDERSFVDERMSFYNKLILFLCISANMAGSSSFVGAFISREVRLPFPAWYPFDWKSNYTGYVLAFIFQVIGMVIQSNLNVSMDLFSAYLMHVGSVKLAILGRRLQKLSVFPAQGQFNLLMDNKTKKQHVSSLIRCLVDYQRIMKYSHQLQEYFTYGFFIQISLSGVVICFVAYQLTTLSPLENIALYTFMITFETCMITQMSLPCYFGNEFILKHDSLKGCIFESGWHLQSSEYQKIVIIFMELVKKQQSILVGNLFVLNLDLFTSIMKFAYRLYAVLV